jgi:hypothetical protein
MRADRQLSLRLLICCVKRIHGLALEVAVRLSGLLFGLAAGMGGVLAISPTPPSPPVMSAVVATIDVGTTVLRTKATTSGQNEYALCGWKGKGCVEF